MRPPPRRSSKTCCWPIRKPRGSLPPYDKIASAAVNFFKANNIKDVFLCHAAAGTRDTVYTWLNDGWDYGAYDQNPVDMGAAVMKAIQAYFATGAVNTEPTVVPGTMRFAGDEYVCDPVYYK
jgi:ABC-type sugar transport system substrate-binding protein